MKLLRNTRNKINADENCENVLPSEFIEVILIHCDSNNNNYQHDSRIFHIFFLDKLFDI